MYQINFFPIQSTVDIVSDKMLFFKAQTMFRLFVFYAFYLVFIEMHPIETQTKYITRKIGDKEYFVKLSFSRFSPSATTESDYKIILDETISLNCEDIEFECRSDQRCIPLDAYCNGKNDCQPFFYFLTMMIQQQQLQQQHHLIQNYLHITVFGFKFFVYYCIY